MPRATFGGVTFDLLLNGLQDTHEGFTTVRDIPGSAAGPARAYVDLGGPQLQRRTAQLKVDSEADYRTLAGLVGTPSAAGTLSHPAEGAARSVVLVSLSRTWRKGTGPQLCRSEWVYTT